MKGTFKSPDNRNHRDHCTKIRRPEVCVVTKSSHDAHWAGELITMPTAKHQLNADLGLKGRAIMINGTWVRANSVAICQLKSAVTEQEYARIQAMTALGPSHRLHRTFLSAGEDTYVQTAMTKRYPIKSTTLRYTASASSDGSGQEDATQSNSSPKDSKVTIMRALRILLSSVIVISRLPCNASGNKRSASEYAYSPGETDSGCRDCRVSIASIPNTSHEIYSPS